MFTPVTLKFCRFSNDFIIEIDFHLLFEVYEHTLCQEFWAYLELVIHVFRPRD